MTYTVLWVPQAEQRLAALWLSAPDREAVTTAAHRIDQQLRSNPEDQGEARSVGQRVLIDPPLGVIFQVQPEDRVVYVLTVWRFDKRPRSPKTQENGE
jgi:mRNA-degrading endonuclease RelE of RelBE toxin-antitoxin system